MAKYDPLLSLHIHTGTNLVTLRFDDIATRVGGLPRSAYVHRAWWANEHGGNHVQAHAWMGAGYRVKNFDLQGQWVTFSR